MAPISRELCDRFPRKVTTTYFRILVITYHSKIVNNCVINLQKKLYLQSDTIFQWKQYIEIAQKLHPRVIPLIFRNILRFPRKFNTMYFGALIIIKYHSKMSIIVLLPSKKYSSYKMTQFFNPNNTRRPYRSSTLVPPNFPKIPRSIHQGDEKSIYANRSEISARAAGKHHPLRFEISIEEKTSRRCGARFTRDRRDPINRNMEKRSVTRGDNGVVSPTCIRRCGETAITNDCIGRDEGFVESPEQVFGPFVSFTKRPGVALSCKCLAKDAAGNEWRQRPFAVSTNTVATQSAIAQPP